MYAFGRVREEGVSTRITKIIRSQECVRERERERERIAKRESSHELIALLFGGRCVCGLSKSQLISCQVDQKQGMLLPWESKEKRF